VTELESPDPSLIIVITEFKFRFLKIICDYEHYLPLNLPLADDLSHTNIMDIKRAYWKRHFLAGLVIDEIEKCMDKPQREVRIMVRLVSDKVPLDCLKLNTLGRQFIL